MDISELLAFVWVFLMGVYFTLSSFLDIPYESIVDGMMGCMLLIFVGWAFFTSVCERYKVVRR